MPCFALPAGALPYPCPSLGDGGLIQERLVIWVKFPGKTVLDVWPKIFTFQAVDTLPEWSKGVDSSCTSANCAGSNPTGVLWLHSSSPTPTKKQSVAAAGMLSPTETLSPGRAVKGLPDRKIRHRGDSSPSGQSPLDFESNSLAARTQCLLLSKTCIFQNQKERATPSTCSWCHTRASR